MYVRAFNLRSGFLSLHSKEIGVGYSSPHSNFLGQAFPDAFRRTVTGTPTCIFLPYRKSLRLSPIRGK